MFNSPKQMTVGDATYCPSRRLTKIHRRALRRPMPACTDGTLRQIHDVARNPWPGSDGLVDRHVAVVTALPSPSTSATQRAVRVQGRGNGEGDEAGDHVRVRHAHRGVDGDALKLGPIRALTSWMAIMNGVVRNTVHRSAKPNLRTGLGIGGDAGRVVVSHGRRCTRTHTALPKKQFNFARSRLRAGKARGLQEEYRG